MARRTRAMAGAAAAALLLGTTTAVGSGGSGAAPGQAACTEPHAPGAFARTYPQQESLPVVAGEDVAWVPSPLDAGDPARTYTSPEGEVGAYQLGDLDGDGLGEVVVHLMLDPQQVWLVPGTTPAGDHDPAAVGIAIPSIGVAVVDDRDGDGTDDVLLTDPGAGPTRILSGAEVLGAGAGGDATDLTPLVDVPGGLVAMAQLDDGPAVVVTAEAIAGPEGTGGVVLRLGDESGTTAFTTQPHPFVPNYTSLVAVPEVLVDGPVVHLVLRQTDRTGALAYLWRVDDPCAAPVVVAVPTATTQVTPGAPPVAPPPAGAASAVAGRPAYTG